MTIPDGDSRSHSRRRWVAAAVWSAWMTAFVGAVWSLPQIRHEHFWNWWGSQDSVIRHLAEQQRWQGALARVDRLAEESPWDPRPDHQRAELLLGQRRGRVRDPAADPEVAAAFAQAGRRYFAAAMYPYLMSPRWQSRMSSAFHQWAVCESRRGDMRQAAFCLEYAADLDPQMATRLIEGLGSESQRSENVADELLEVLVKITLRTRGPREALSTLEKVRPGLGERLAYLLEIDCRLADSWWTEPVSHPDAAQRQQWLNRHLPTRLAHVRATRELSGRRGSLNRPGRRHTVDEARLVGSLVTRQIRDLTRFAETSMTRERSGGRRGWNFVSNSSVTMSWERSPITGEEFWLLARGTPALGVWPVLEVEVNGGSPQHLYVRSDQLMAVTLDVPGGELRSVVVRFVNDGGFPRLTADGEMAEVIEDRNVWVQGVWGNLPLPATEEKEDRDT